jgi:hypothetical protein
MATTNGNDKQWLFIALASAAGFAASYFGLHLLHKHGHHHHGHHHHHGGGCMGGMGHGYSGHGFDHMGPFSHMYPHPGMMFHHGHNHGY